MSLSRNLNKKPESRATYPVLLPIWRMKLKRLRNLVEAKESFSCPFCHSENAITDDSDEDALWYECLDCGMSGWVNE